MKRPWHLIQVFIAAALLAAPGAWAGEDGETVSILIGNDLYAAGGNLTIDRHAGSGDILASGGRVVLDTPAPAAAILVGGLVAVRKPVQGDAMLAGGSVEVEAAVGDDVRAAGGTVTLAAPVGGDLVAAGGEVEVLTGATVAGEAFLAGGRVVMRGRIGKSLSMWGDVVVLDGAVQGPVEVTARERLEIGPNAVIAGDLTYRSPEPASIHPGAVLNGKTEHLPLPERYLDEWDWLPWLVGAGVAGVLGFWLLAAVLLVFFHAFTQTATGKITEQMWKALALGFALFFTLPAAAIVLTVTVIGAPLGLLLLLLVYPLAIIGGWLLFAVRIGEWGLGLIGPARDAPVGWRLLFALKGVLALALLSAIPVLGGLLWLLATCLGMGALALVGWQRYKGQGTRRSAWR
ncbi:MAG: hypothetical protein V3S29_08665 [bacterium]